MRKYVYTLLISTTFLFSAHAMKKITLSTDPENDLHTNNVPTKKSSSLFSLDESSSNNDSEKLFLSAHQTNLEEVLIQQKKISDQLTSLQTQFFQKMLDIETDILQLEPLFDKFSKSSEVVQELRRKKMRERITQKEGALVTKAGIEAIYNAKTKWKMEKINNYRLHKEKVDHEIRRAIDEGRTKHMFEGIRQYEPVEISINGAWMFISDYRKKRNAEFDQKQKALKKQLLEEAKKQAEEQETRKIYKEALDNNDKI